MAKISFENIALDGTSADITDGYRNLNWDVFYAIDDELLEKVLGNSNAVRTGEAAAYGDPDESKRIAGFRSVDRVIDFDLDSGYFTAFNANDLKVKVFGFDDGERVAKQIFTLDPDGEFVRFGAEFNDIDEVRFRVSGGTDATPNDGVGVSPAFLMDDLFLNF